MPTEKERSLSTQKAIIKLIPVFRKYGYEGTTLSMLSQASGLSKASLYHHFPKGKEEMAGAVFDYVGSCFRDKVLKPLWEQGEPVERIQAMCHSLQEFYDNGRNTCFLAIMSFGEADNLFHDSVKQRLQIWIDTLARVLIEAGIEPNKAKDRSIEAIMQIQGALVLVRILDDFTIFKKAIEDLPRKLFNNDRNES
ncbi:MAG: TetR/AcrR family transcriptional regulator [Xenococcaceae cyanobacterium]